MPTVLRIASVLAALSLGGCYVVHEPAPDLLVCPPDPYTGERTLFRADGPPRGRIGACEACSIFEEELLARAVELGCPLRSGHQACTLTGACDYAASVGTLADVRGAASCELLDALADTDSCARPDPRYYWRPEGD